MTITTGALIGRYEIRSRIGIGGMGEVFLANDTQLKRPAAIKFLSEDLTSDPTLLRRFEQEALAASALNHPNILTVYEIGQAEGLHFIATEFIDGVTLREQMSKAPLNMSELLDTALQIASALTAAHEVGMVHRDIKPENIMVRRDGIVKVLDFGIAKLTQKTEEAAAEDATIQQVFTQAGMIIGTARYMSPEQARGQKVDARSDIWSFGILLYEMLVGKPPFEGSTSSDIIAEVLKAEPEPLTSYLPDAPPELQRIIKKALRKDREERFQTIKEMLIDLKNLKRQLDIESEIGPTLRSLSSERIHTTSGKNLEADLTVKLPVSDTTAIHHTQQNSNQNSALRRRFGKWSLALMSIVLLAIVGAAIFGVYRLLSVSSSDKKLNIAYQTMKVTPLTGTGKISGAAISPDGKYVAQVTDETGQRSIFVRQVATTSDVLIVPASEDYYSGLVFSKDGNFLYYLKRVRGESFWALYQIPVLGGNGRKIIDKVDSVISFSPDQKQFTFTRFEPNTGDILLMLANNDGSGERKITSRKDPEWLGTPSWSADGKTILCSAAEKNLTKIIELDVQSGTEKPFGSLLFYTVNQIIWMPDGNGILISAKERDAQNSQLYYLSYPDANLQRITNDSNNYYNVGLTNDSNTILTIKSDQLSDIWLADDTKPDNAKQITSGKYDGCCGISWSPDNHIVFASTASGRHDIWIMNSDGSNKKQLTNNMQNNYYPVVTADGKSIYFVSDRSGTYEIWRMDIDGGNPKQITTDKNIYGFTLTPDNRWIVYTGVRDGKTYLWKIPFDSTGEPIQITNATSGDPHISPDSKKIIYSFWEESTNKYKFAIADFETGQVKRTFELPPTASDWAINWTPDGKMIAYVDTRGGISNIWTQQIEGETTKQLTNFKNNLIFHFRWSTDGKQMAISRGIVNRDIVLINNFKQ